MWVKAKKLSTFNFQLSTPSGYTLIELLVYMGIFSILIGVLSSLFGVIIDTQLESKSNSIVDQDGKYILAKLAYDFQSTNAYASGSQLLTPASPGSSSATLQFDVNSEVYTYALDGSNNLLLTNDSGSNNLNSVNTTISNLGFTRIGAGDDKDTIRLNFTVTSKIRERNGYESRAYETTLRMP